jgi:hypothetical protein
MMNAVMLSVGLKTAFYYASQILRVYNCIIVDAGKCLLKSLLLFQPKITKRFLLLQPNLTSVKMFVALTRKNDELGKIKI